jgi:hypothetical protein
MTLFELRLPASWPRKHLMVTMQRTRASSEAQAREIASRGCGVEGKEVWLRDAEVTEVEDGR